MTVYLDDAFTGDSPGTPLTSHTPDIGSAWSAVGAGVEIGSSGYVVDKATSGHNITVHPVASDTFKLTFNEVTFSRGSANGRWSGIVIGSDGTVTKTLSIRPNGTSGAPTLRLWVGTATTEVDWGSGYVVDGGTYDIEVLVNGATRELAVIIDGTDIVTHTIGSTAFANAFPSGSTYVGFYGNERNATTADQWGRITCEDPPVAASLFRWDGSALVPAVIEQWDGSAFVPGALSVA